ncbi:MAG: circadian clock protein KaiC [Chloroflexota bacterium]
MSEIESNIAPGTIEKALTGIEGFDEITGGGLPRRRTTLLLGGPGSGKTVFALNTLVNGARLYGEPGIFVAFEENSAQIFQNAASFGWELPALVEQQLFFLDARMSVSQIKTGGFDLTGMLAGLLAKSQDMSAATGKLTRIVFDSADVLLNHLRNPYAEMEEMQRIHEWLANHRFTGIITSKAQLPGSALPDQRDYLQYMADCVIELKRGMIENVSNRSLTVVKYRGSSFAENAASLVIGPDGIQVPNLSLFGMTYPVSNERISTGIERLDVMLSGGYLRGSSVLITGSPGTSKSTLAGAFAHAACRRGERALYVSFDEGPNEIIRNLASVNLGLRQHVQSGMLRIYSTRAEVQNAVEHLVQIKRLLREHQPQVLVIDPLSAMAIAGGEQLAKTVAQRLIYETKAANITLFLTSLLQENNPEVEATPIEISTIADAWIHLSYVVQAGERNRALTIIKARGTQHSKQVRELVLSSQGISLTDAYTAGGAVLMGTLRSEKEAADREARQQMHLEQQNRRRSLMLKQAEARARLELIQQELASQQVELDLLDSEIGREDRQHQVDLDERRTLRGGHLDAGQNGSLTGA